MKTQTYISRILWYEGLGFLAIIAALWITELSNFPAYFGDIPVYLNWEEALFESLIVLVVAIPVIVLTRKLISRLYYLEGFLRICAWCKKIENDNEWIPIEDFFEEKFKTKSSHGICSNCLKDVKSTADF